MLSASAVPLVHAQGLPTLEDPSRGTGSGIMETLRNYGYDIVLLVALLVVASMFIGVCYHAYSTYSEIHTGRKTWGQFGLTVAVGAILLVAKLANVADMRIVSVLLLCVSGGAGAAAAFQTVLAFVPYYEEEA